MSTLFSVPPRSSSESNVISIKTKAPIYRIEFINPSKSSASNLSEFSESSPKLRTDLQLKPSTRILSFGVRTGLLILVFLVLFASFQALARPRISSIFFDRSTVGQLFIRPGLSSIVQFPCEIDEVKVGLKESLNTSISKTLPSELVLSAQKTLIEPTNLIVRCSHGVFIFDVTPSRSLHQDFVKILGGVSGPKFEEKKQKGKKMYSSKSTPTKSLGERLKKTARVLPKNSPSSHTRSLVKRISIKKLVSGNERSKPSEVQP